MSDLEQKKKATETGEPMLPRMLNKDYALGFIL